MSDEVKACAGCGAVKPLDAFHRSGPHRRKSECADCVTSTHKTFNVGADIHAAVKAAAGDRDETIEEFVTRACARELMSIYDVDADRLEQIRADREFVASMGDRSSNRSVTRTEVTA